MKLPITNYQLPITRRRRPGAPGSPRRRVRGFSLVEVLLAIFILGIGMIMVASVFPVGANWTRQTAEASVGQTVAQDALAVIRTHYGPNGDLQKNLADPTINTVLQSNPFQLQAFPSFLSIPASERSYQFGSANPFPAGDPTRCTYFWTALIRLNPAHRGGAGIMPAPSYNYDVYILVMRKGAVEQQFIYTSGEVSGTRNSAWTFMPCVSLGGWSGGSATAGGVITGAVPPIGQYGIDATAGTVFRQVTSSNYQSAMPRPAISGGSVIYAPAADNTAVSASPLIYIYQTTMAF